MLVLLNGTVAGALLESSITLRIHTVVVYGIEPAAVVSGHDGDYAVARTHIPFNPPFLISPWSPSSFGFGCYVSEVLEPKVCIGMAIETVSSEITYRTGKVVVLFQLCL